MTLYDLFGLPHWTSGENIAAEYKFLAKSMHPDLGGDPDRFMELTAAYNVLSNPIKKAEYDKTLRFTYDECKNCNGTGSLRKYMYALKLVIEKCSNCNGLGLVPRSPR
jgi:DnaJ-class molecular chaperone